MYNLTAALKILTETLAKLGVRHMILGGLANMIWGAARLTMDIDIAVALSEEEINRLVRGLQDAGFAVLVPDPGQFIRETRVLPCQTLDGIRVDLIFVLLPYERRAIERAVPVDLGGVQVPCCTAEDLIILKAVSTRAKDREDIRGIVHRRGAEFDLDYLLPILEEMASLLERSDLQALCRELESMTKE